MLHALAAAANPPNVTVLVPWLVPNPVPLMVTFLPIGWVVGLTELMCGRTVNFTPLLA